MSINRRELDRMANRITYHEEEAHLTGRNVIRTIWDAQPWLDEVAYRKEQPVGKEFRHAAVIPMDVLEQSFREGWYHDKKKWKDWANDPDNKKWRTWEGRL